MGVPILSVRDDQGNIIPIPAIQGRDGVDGKDGKDGAAGPNLINQNTLTPMAGILMGSGGSVKTAVSGTDYATPAAVDAKLDAADYTRTINTATTTGAAANFVLTLDPAPDALVQGMMLLVNFHTGSDATMTPPVLSVNGFGGKYLMPVGVNSARPFAAGVHIVFYDGTYWRMIDNAFLPIIGGTVYGSIIPKSALEYNLGSSEIPWQYMYATAGRFSNSLTVNGNSVWHQGNAEASRFTLSLSVSSASNLSFYIKDPVTGIVHVNISASGMPISVESKIATLPAGCRPGQMIYSGTASSGESAMYGFISTNGEIKAKNVVMSTNAQAWTFLQFTFVAEN